MDLSDFEAHIAQHRPQLKPNSVRTYALSLKSLAPLGSTDFGWVKDVDYVLEAIKKFKESDDDEQVRKTALREVRILKVPPFRHCQVIARF